MTVVQRVFKDLPQKPVWLNAIQQSPYCKCPKTYYAIVLVFFGNMMYHLVCGPHSCVLTTMTLSPVLYSPRNPLALRSPSL